MRHTKKHRAARRHEHCANSTDRCLHGPITTKQLDFKQGNHAATCALPIIVTRWLPRGRRCGREHVAPNPTGPHRHLGSFKIVISGPGAGPWADFATRDKDRDVLSLVEEEKNTVQQPQARKWQRGNANRDVAS
jgi:hypothetical protein